MRGYLNLFIALVIAGTLGAIGTFLCLNWKSSQDRPCGNLQELQHHSRELDTRLAGAARRNAAKEKIAKEVLAGRRGLIEAAALFQELDAQDPHFHVGAFRLLIPGTTDEERYCRSVIAWVRNLPPPSPSEDPATPLEAELGVHLGRPVFPPVMVRPFE